MLLDILASGSNANCALVRHGKTAILVDAGLDYRRTLTRLAEIGVDPGDISAAALTHGHGDHSKGVPLLAARLGIPVYATQGTLNEIKWGNVGPVKCIPIDDVTHFDIGSFVCCAWPVPHDATNPVAFSFGCDDGVISIVMDTGSITEDLAVALKASSQILIESNWDEDLLSASEYPAHLKKRISGPKGHLSTQALCRFLPQLDPAITKRVVVGHLSRANTRPELVRLMCRAALRPEITLEVV